MNLKTAANNLARLIEQAGLDAIDEFAAKHDNAAIPALVRQCIKDVDRMAETFDSAVSNAIRERDVVWLKAHDADRTDYACGLTEEDIKGMVQRGCKEYPALDVAIARFPYRLLLPWEKRRDGYWNADCPCGGSLCGVLTEHERIGVEAWHFSDAVVQFNAEETERYARIHRFAFAPENNEWLARWFELCAESYAAQRKSTIAGATQEQFEVLQLQDAHRKNLMDRLKLAKEYHR